MDCRWTVSHCAFGELTVDPLNVKPGPEKLLATIFPDMISRRGDLKGSAARVTAMKSAMVDVQNNHDETKYSLLLDRALSRAVSS